jgi:hypothetical protein
MVTVSSSDTFTNKTIDASGTGNVLKTTGYILLPAPHRFDGTGAVAQTDSTTSHYGQALFSDDGAKTANYVEYRLQVPSDIDTAVDLTATFKFQLSAADTGKHCYKISSVSVADSSSYGSPTLASEVNMPFAGDASGASGDVETVGPITLTGWKSALTSGQLWVIRLARDGGNEGTDCASGAGSTVDSYSGPLMITYGKTQ